MEEHSDSVDIKVWFKELPGGCFHIKGDNYNSLDDIRLDVINRTVGLASKLLTIEEISGNLFGSIVDVKLDGNTIISPKINIKKALKNIGKIDKLLECET